MNPQDRQPTHAGGQRQRGKTAGGAAPLDSHGFRNAVTARAASDPLAPFTIIRLEPGAFEQAKELCRTALRELRAARGEMIGLLDGAVAVYLEGDCRAGAQTFVNRVRDAWRRLGSGDLASQVALYPAEEHRIGELLRNG